MKICVTRSPNPKIVGMAQALSSIINNAQFLYWDSNAPIFKILKEVAPDVVFFTPDDIEEQHLVYCKAESPNTKFVLIEDKEPVQYEHIDFKISLINQNEKYYLDYLADPTLFSNGESNEQLACDFLIFSSPVMQDKNISGWINTICSNYNVKIFGNAFSSPYYLGAIDVIDVKHAIQSCKGLIALNNEWYFNTLMNKKIPMCLGSNSNNNKKFIFNNFTELKEMCDKVIAGDIQIANEDFGVENTHIAFANKVKEGLGI